MNGQGRVVDPQPGQNGWTFKHAQDDMKNMVGFRVTTYGTDVVNKWTSAQAYRARVGRGSKGCIAINNGSGAVRSGSTPHRCPSGEYYNVIKAKKTGNTWSGKTTIKVYGWATTATLGGKDAIALHVDPRRARSHGRCEPLSSRERQSHG